MMAYPFRHNQNLSQFELQLQDELAFVEYFTQDKKMYLTHTEVPGAYATRASLHSSSNKRLPF